MAGSKSIANAVSTGRVSNGEGRTFHRRRACRFCADREITIDYKNRAILQPYLTERSKIVPRRISGICARHQRELSTAVKRARHLAIVPYSSAQL